MLTVHRISNDVDEDTNETQVRLVHIRWWIHVVIV